MEMVYISRDDGGGLSAVFANPQPQPDGSHLNHPEPLPADHPEVLAFWARLHRRMMGEPEPAQSFAFPQAEPDPAKSLIGQRGAATPEAFSHVETLRTPPDDSSPPNPPPGPPIEIAPAPTEAEVGAAVAEMVGRAAPQFSPPITTPTMADVINPADAMASNWLQTEMSDPRESIALAKDRQWDEYNDLLNKSGGGFARPDEQARLRVLSANLADFKKAT